MHPVKYEEADHDMKKHDQTEKHRIRKVYKYRKQRKYKKRADPKSEAHLKERAVTLLIDINKTQSPDKQEYQKNVSRHLYEGEHAAEQIYDI